MVCSQPVLEFLAVYQLLPRCSSIVVTGVSMVTVFEVLPVLVQDRHGGIPPGLSDIIKSVSIGIISHETAIPVYLWQ